MRKHLVIICAVLSLSCTPLQAQEKKLRIATPYKGNSEIGIKIQELAQSVLKQSGEMIQIKADFGINLSEFSLDRAYEYENMFVLPSEFIKSENMTEFNIWSVPFLFLKHQEIIDYQRSILGEKALVNIQKKGWIALGYWNGGLDSVFSPKFMNAKKLNGLKIGVNKNKNNIANINGISEVSMPRHEMISALERGLIDAVSGDGDFYADFNLRTGYAAPFVPKVSIFLLPATVWKELPFRVASILVHEVERLGARLDRLEQENEDELVSKFRLHGVSVAAPEGSQSKELVEFWYDHWEENDKSVLRNAIEFVEGRRGRGMNAPVSPSPGNGRGDGSILPVSPIPGREDGEAVPLPYDRQGKVVPLSGWGGDAVMFVTDRLNEGIPLDPVFGRKRNDNGIVYGAAKISLPNSRAVGELDEDDAEIMQVSVLTRKEFLESMNRVLEEDGSKDVNVFVHGYRTTFDSALKKFKALAEDMNVGGVSIVFSWPSDGLAGYYVSDAEEVRSSRKNFVHFINMLRENIDEKEINFIAHSMGARLVTDAVEWINHVKKSGIADDIILAAPDVSVPRFQQVVNEMIDSSNRLTLYASEADCALTLSDGLNDNDRAGEAGESLVVVSGMDTIDVSLVERGLFNCRHSYVMTNRAVISDVSAIIGSGMPPTRRTGLERKLKGNLPYWRFRP